MPEKHHTLNASLKTLVVLARWTLWVVASIWLILIMVWIALHFVIVPRIADFRPLLEQQASRVLGVNVRVGAVMALSNGLIPSFEFRDVILLDANDREALHLPSVLAALSPRSLLGLGFEQVYVAAPVLDVRRARDGQFWIAGLPLAPQNQAYGVGADWLFSQTELVVRHGTVNWTDELRGTPLLALTDVDLVLRNKHRRHTLRVDVSPPAHWGERIQVVGDFKQALFANRAGQWRDWEGQLFGDFSEVDLSHLRQYVDLGVDVAHGTGALRAWVDLKKGALTGATADIALRDASIQVTPSLEPVNMRWAAGRLGVKFRNDDVELFTQALEFDTLEGLHWSGGNLRIHLQAGIGGAAPQGALIADKLDVAAMAQIADRLPLPESIRVALDALRPKGLISHLQLGWSGPIQSAVKFTARGSVGGLAFSSWARPRFTIPGITAAQVDFDISQDGGTFKVDIRDGSLDLEGLLDQPVIAIGHLSGHVNWKNDVDRMGLSASDVRWTNADGQCDLQFKWHTSPVTVSRQSRTDNRFPGVLDLQANFIKVQANQIHKYLPVGIEQPVRTYIRDAIVSGTVKAAKIKVKGSLAMFPFADAKQGEFQVLADLQEVVFAYSPASLMSVGSPPWPSLTQLSGELAINHAVLQVKGAHAAVAGLPGLQVTRADAEIRNLYGGATLAVTAEARGPLAEIVALVNNSPLSGMTSKALSRAAVSGSADYRFKLGIPLAALDRAVVQGTIGLSGNDIQVTPETPKMTRARGVIVFSENGFGVNGGQVRALGGEAKIDGVIGSVLSGIKPSLQGLRIQGTATVDGLRQARELGLVARLAQYGSGGASYSAILGARGLVSELSVTSNLVGMALALPAPFNKVADAALPFRMESVMMSNDLPLEATGKVRERDQLKLDIGRIASLVYQRDVSGAEPRVLRGSIAVGLAPDESAPLPEEGVIANVNTPQIDLDAWSSVLTQSAGSEPTGAFLTGTAVAQGYLPNLLAVRAQVIVMSGRKLHNVALGGGREGLLWRANLSADELNGYVEYRQSSGSAAGRLHARLARLTIGPGTAQEVEALLDEQPASIPALDIVVEDFELRGKKLGRIDIDAVNLAATNSVLKEAPREWRLNRFNITTSEAFFAATGNWTNIVALVDPADQRPVRERRRTALKFKLDINDAGALLERFGMPGVVRSGAGKIEGRIGWLGSPITFDYATLGGDLNVNVENGQFLKTDPGIGRLLGVLSLQSLPRRLALDFRDVFSDGFAFDFFRGDVAIIQGLARTNNLQMKGVAAAVVMEGQADIAMETQNLKVVVVPEINAGSASLLASYINPIWGLSSFLAQWIVRKPLMDSLTQEFLIDGTWLEPRVTKMERK